MSKKLNPQQIEVIETLLETSDIDQYVSAMDETEQVFVMTRLEDQAGVKEDSQAYFYHREVRKAFEKMRSLSSDPVH